jgi:hypothetical protein
MAAGAENHLDDLRRSLDGIDPRQAKAERAAAIICRVGSYRWVGLYDVGPVEISVIGWHGPSPPTHPRFPRSHGLNGAAAASGTAVIVQDVSTDTRYLPTIGGTQALVFGLFMFGGWQVYRTQLRSRANAENERRRKGFLPPSGSVRGLCRGAAVVRIGRQDFLPRDEYSSVAASKEYPCQGAIPGG